MDDKITIIEGPTPQFMHVDEDWARGIFEGPSKYKYSFTNLRTFNGQALIERCYRTWRTKGMMYLEYRDDMGLTLRSPSWLPGHWIQPMAMSSSFGCGWTMKKNPKSISMMMKKWIS